MTMMKWIRISSSDLHSELSVQYTPWRQPRGKMMVSLVNSHTNATRIGWHLWEADSRFSPGLPPEWKKVDVRLPGKGNQNSYGERPIHLIITMFRWIRTSRLSTRTFSLQGAVFRNSSLGFRIPPPSTFVESFG